MENARICTTAASKKNTRKITVTGNLEVYAPQGKYQIIARKVAPAGEGDLMARYLEIKRNLDAEGLFAP